MFRIAPYDDFTIEIAQHIPPEVAELILSSFNQNSSRVLFSFQLIRVVIRSGLNAVKLRLWDGAACKIPKDPVVVGPVVAMSASGRL
jgi:hypothetical protein